MCDPVAALPVSHDSHADCLADPENMPDTSVLGLGGFLFAGVLGVLLAWAIWRHGRL